MTLHQLLGCLRAAGFRHVVAANGEALDEGYRLGANGDYRMWHPLLVRPEGDGSAYVGDRPELYVDATGAVATCFADVLGVQNNARADGAGAGTARWTGTRLDQLLNVMGRLRP